jgi:AcrR family transcriptional regulator
VVDAAIALADEEGVEALSMRKVAERLGIGAMSLYTYVESKSELIDLMIDRVVSELARPDRSALPWRERLEGMARDEYEHALRHPWMLHVDTSRPPLGPGISDRYEYQLSLIEGIGLTDLQMDAVLGLVAGFATASARTAIDSQRSATTSGQTDIEWWEANLPVLNRVMDGSRFPLSGRVGQAVGAEYEAVNSPGHFEFGLARVLDGVEALLAR